MPSYFALGRSLVTLCCGVAFAAPMAFAAEAPRAALLLVASQGDASLSIVNLASKQRTASVAEGIPAMVGHEVAVSPDHRYAYLPLYGDSGVGRPGTDGRVMLVIDLATHKIVKQVDFGHGVRPHCAVYDPVSGMLYVTTELDRSVSIIDPKTLRIVGSVSTEQEQSHMLAVSHDGRHGYTANVGPGTVSVLDLAGRKFVKTIPVSGNTQRIAISNDDKFVYTADQTRPQMAIIDTGTNTRTGWLPLPAIGYGAAFTRDGRSLLVTQPSTGELALADLKANKVTRTIAVGPHPQEVILSPDGKTAFVSLYGSHQVAVVDLSTWQVTAKLDAGERADGMAWVPASR